MFGCIREYFSRRKEKKILVKKRTTIEQAIEHNFKKLSRDQDGDIRENREALRSSSDLAEEYTTFHASGMTSISRGEFISTADNRLPKGSPQILPKLRDEIFNLEENLKTIEDLDKLDQ